MSPAVAAAFSDYAKKGVMQRTQATPRLLALDRCGFATEEEVYTREEWLAEPHVVEWSRDWGFDHAAATAIHNPSGELMVIHIERLADRPAFNRKDLDVLDSVRPHLARAALLAARWRLEKLRAAAEALAAIGLPALIVDRNARALAANKLVEDLAGYVRWLPKDRIALIDPAANGMFRLGLAGLSDPRASSVRSFAARTGTGENPVVAHLISTPGQARDLFDGALGVLVLTPVTAPAAPDAALICGLFDLTPNEARTAQGIAKGLTIDEIADRHAVSRETIRSQVKAVLAKTGTRHQVEAASLFRGLPKFPIAEL